MNSVEATTWQSQLNAAIDVCTPQLVTVRRHLHAHPEPSGDEFGTSLYLHRLLSDAGFLVRIGPVGRGVIADFENAGTGPLLALRADIDALRIQDAKDVVYRSQCSGLMHACGHDGHTATVLGALLGLQTLKQQGLLPPALNVRGIFQPAEETGKGALEMIAAGALDDVAAILSVHLDPTRAVGRIGVRYGALTAACDEVEIHITGRGGHAARPHQALDPIHAAAQFITTLYQSVPRAVDSQDAAVVTIGQVTAGDSSNVIPDHALLRGTLRTLSGTVRVSVKNHIHQLAVGLAEASGTRIEIQFGAGPPSVENDDALTDLVRIAGSDVLGSGQIDTIARPSMGGEDFAFYLQEVPGAMFRLGCASAVAGGAPLHSPHFDIDEAALTIGAKVLARAAVLWPDAQAARH